MNKQLQLDVIAKEIALCRTCKKDSSGISVPGEGNPDAAIVFLGEAPGKQEAKTGRPFIGRSGQLLRKMIRAIGLKEEEVFITSPVKYLPDAGTPTKEQILHAKKHLMKQLDVIKPKLIILLGATAVKAILGQTLPILKTHGTIVDNTYFITLHPAAVIRFPKYAHLMEDDFRNVIRYVE